MKAALIMPAAALFGLWYTLDAEALAAGTRRHQAAIAWVLTIAGVGTGALMLWRSGVG